MKYGGILRIGFKLLVNDKSKFTGLLMGHTACMPRYQPRYKESKGQTKKRPKGQRPINRIARGAQKHGWYYGAGRCQRCEHIKPDSRKLKP